MKRHRHAKTRIRRGHRTGPWISPETAPAWISITIEHKRTSPIYLYMLCSIYVCVICLYICYMLLYIYILNQTFTRYMSDRFEGSGRMAGPSLEDAPQ